MKFKIFSFKSIVTYLTMVSFYIATTLSAFAAPLPPISLAQMYSLASQGNVRALRAAVQRGMNIDATDRYGNTGLCHSIYQNNYTAYNAFHASGANPRHPCIQNIPPQQYDYFMASSRATPVTATPRDAYKEFADGEFVFSTTTWVIGGLLLAGGIAAIALSGGGGGKKHHYYFPPNDSFTPTDDSLGAFVGTETPSAPENSPYTPVKITNGENDSNFTLSNDSQIKVGDETKNLVDVINLNDSVLDYTKYIQVGMKAIDGNQVVNGKIPLTGTEVGATITLQNNTAGMVALHNSNAINNNTLKIIARNGTLGMIASDKSLVRNNGNIDIAFQGTTATDQVDGMYADTSSTAINDGKITGNAAVDSVAGTLIGMQGRLINQVQNPAGTIPTQLINNGNISLSAAATPDKTISTSLVGMGSFLEKAFLEGTKLLRRTGFIEITNAANGVIDLNVNLGDSGTYDSTQSNLLNGTGGIVGIRSDAHTTATNNGAIRLTIAPESTNNITNSHAGMLSVHGGTIVNNKEITVTGGIGGYGMLGVRGEGTNSEFNTLNPTIVNSESGTITGDTSAGSVDICDDGGSCANKFIHLEQGATLQNSGTMVTSASFKLNEMGGGRVLLASTGTMVAGNEISGDLYAVSDRAMLEQGQKDVYVNRNALTASEIDVNLMSASPMWEVSLVDSAEDSADDAAAQAEDEPAVEQPTVKDEDEADNDSSTSDKPSSEKDIVYNRVAFSNLVNNASQAAYLESNYAIRNTIYDGMITAGSMEEFNQALYSNLGLDLIPNFAKQNMDILRNVNRQVNSAVFNNNDTKEFRVHVGYDYFEREQDGTNGLSGYEDEAHTGYALFDKKYNANFRYGLGASFTKYSSDYDNGAERDEVIAQIMAPLIFETDSTKVVSMPRIGMGWGEYTRYDHTGEYKADTRNYYYGITNEARHELDMGLLTLEPVAEFNIIGLYQGRTKENIRVDSGNNLSVEGGLGLYAKKSFKPMGDDELNIRLGGTYYHEFNNPYQAVSAGIVGLQGRYHMNSYETQRNRAVLSSRFDYKRGKFNFYLEGSRFIEDDSTYSVNAGLTYAF